jgi:hypothetical protein
VAPAWQATEAQRITEYIAAFRDSASSSALLSGGVNLASPHLRLYQDLSPIISYILYLCALVCAPFVQDPNALTAQDKVRITIISKLVLFVVDSAFLVFCTVLYVSLTYSNLRKQIKYCYLGLILLCPVFFIREYMHLGFECLGYHLLFLIVYLHEMEERVAVGVLSSVLANLHPGYLLITPFLFLSLAFKAKRHRFATQAGVWRQAYTALDIGQLLSAFAAGFLLILAPWYSHLDGVPQFVDLLFVQPLRNNLVRTD